MKDIQILIVDYGSQYTLVIGRSLRELGVRSLILPPKKVDQWLKENDPKTVILSGSNWSVHNEGAPELPKSLDITGKKYFILGVCYGMQPETHGEAGFFLDEIRVSAIVFTHTADNTTHPLFS